jgi:hypothetical protein
MAKNRIVASRLLQILGHDGDVEPGTVLATIETDCEIGALLSALQFGNAELEREPQDGEVDEPEQPAEQTSQPASKPPRKSSRRSR